MASQYPTSAAEDWSQLGADMVSESLASLQMEGVETVNDTRSDAFRTIEAIGFDTTDLTGDEQADALAGGDKYEELLADRMHADTQRNRREAERLQGLIDRLQA